MDTLAVKKIVISGYYGFDNSGDEAVLQSILLALEEQGRNQGIRIIPVVLSADPAKTSQTYGVEAVHRMSPGALIRAIRSADGLISGGGSLLQDATGAKTIPYYLGILKLAQWLGKPTFIYSQGIGPVYRGMFFGWIRSVFNRCRLVSVRDVESKQLLLKMKVKNEIIVVPDPVMGMPLNTGEHGIIETLSMDTPIIGISVRYWNQDRSEIKAIAEAITMILEKTDSQIRFLPFHLPSDEEASNMIRAQLDGQYNERISISHGVTHPQQMLAEVGRCDLLIGMRLHSLIYAASQLVPLLGISYDPKIDQFLNRLDMQSVAHTSSIDNETGVGIAEAAIKLLQQRLEWRAKKQPLIELLKNEAQTPALQIAYFFSKGRNLH
ncbi:polysaccharide pyruvyl transferase CsaB [Paenibacillus sp. 1_12]|uniref:polysaccharide pyruvyl transferase CsaB n=1 Tax=Paenibacillus sp. 1_12 TaxID=1566278 RepID=UPI0008E74ABC|nr:polysaccharide pyruvyl transferase CsaB [Paenibacillus sp. 1_12]SFL88605.1 polysaccharide pyruvyl transferase CsaB [Paenibacillus sp. 1_12]